MKKTLKIMALCVVLFGFPVMGLAQPAPSTTSATATAAKTEPKKAEPAKKESADSQASMWISILTPLVVGLVGALLAFFNKKNKLEALKTERAKMILGFVKTGVESFDRYAKKSGAKWDDTAAKLLGDVNSALLAIGQEPLTPDEAEKVKASAEAQKSLVGPDPAPEKTDEK